jgi:hypothetical protein
MFLLAYIFTAVMGVFISDTTYLGTLSAHTSKSMVLKLPEGTTSVEVYNPNDDTRLDCSFTDLDTGFVGLEQKKVTRCTGVVNNKHPLKLEVEFTNLADKTIDYRVIVKTTTK